MPSVNVPLAGPGARQQADLAGFPLIDVKTKFQMHDGKPELLRLPEVKSIDDRAGSTEEMMFRMFGLWPAGLALAALAAFAGVSTSTGPANAVIYCKTVGVPQGCVVRPVVRRPIVYCKTRGVPKGCIMH